jgi:large subunit ribosomal protein L19
MPTKAKNKTQKESLPEVEPHDIKPGMTVRLHQKIKDLDSKGKERERVQVFEGMVLARRHGREPGATITVRKVSEGVGVEKIIPLASPLIAKIELVKTARVRRAKLGYLRSYKKKVKEKSLAK